jgi:hypothetical protein
MFYPKDDNLKLISNNSHQLKVMRLPRNRRTIIVGGIVAATLLILLFKTNLITSSCFMRENEGSMVREDKYVMGNDQKKYMYHRNMPLVFIGGVPRSGTTLMRVIATAIHFAKYPFNISLIRLSIIILNYVVLMIGYARCTSRSALRARDASNS